MVGDQDVAPGLEKLFLDRGHIAIDSDDAEIRLLTHNACQGLAEQAVFYQQEKFQKVSRAKIFCWFHSAPKPWSESKKSRLEFAC